MKIRTDFVTNSSSSSFIVTFRFDLVNGKSLIFEGNGGVPETGRIDYFENDVAVRVSPKELGKSKTVDEMIEKLINGVLDEDLCEEEDPIKVFDKNTDDEDDEYPHVSYFIDEIRENIKSIT